jgi:MYXO-CTERM domain-containing protein
VDKADIAASGLTGSFTAAGFSGSDQANITDLHNPPEVVGPPGFASQPFMSFNGGGITTTLLINFIFAGIYPPAGCAASPAGVGQTCTSPGSLFSFVNNAGGTSGQALAAWVLSGVTNDGQSTWIANFSSQFNKPFQAVFADLGTAGFVSNTYSATFTLSLANQTPEPPPSTLMGLGLGLVVLAGGLRRRLKSR